MIPGPPKGYLLVSIAAPPWTRPVRRSHLKTSSPSSSSEEEVEEEEEEGAERSRSMAREECFWACAPHPEVNMELVLSSAVV